MRQLNRVTRLYADFLDRKGNLESRFGPAFDDAGAVAALAGSLIARDYPRRELVQALGELADECRAPAQAREQLLELRGQDSLVVFAGQQTGLFTGPVLSIYKALAVERWATDLARQVDVPVIACFWLAGDDHDFEEVSHVEIPCGSAIRKLAYRPERLQAGEPVGRLIVEREMERVFDGLAGALPRTGSRNAVLDALKDAYAVGTRFSTAFARLWYRMFPQSRLLFVSPDHPRLRELVAPLLARSVAGHARLYALYEDASRALEREGYRRQVQKTRDRGFLFHQRGPRLNVRREADGRFSWTGQSSLTAEALQEQILARPEDFSPNVLLRPVIQNALFPVLGVVLGPAETAYHAQIGGFYDEFGVPRPAILPRTSITMMEPFAARCLSRYGIDPLALKAHADREVARVLRARLPAGLESRFLSASRTVEEAFGEIGESLAPLDPGLERAVGAAGTRAAREVDRVARKAFALHNRRQKEIEVQLRRLHLHLFPRGGLQERTFNIVYYWTRYGPRLLSDLYERWPAGGRDHLLWKPA